MRVIHCTTQEEWDAVIDKTGSSIGKNWFEVYGDQSCLWDSNEYTSLVFAKTVDNEIIQAKDFLGIPEKWCIEVTSENREILAEWRGYGEGTLRTPLGWLTYDNIWSNNRPYSYPIISFEDFKKHILKVKKEIIGYKFKQDKKEFEKAALAIAGVSKWLFKSRECEFSKLSELATRLKKAEVLDLWFDEVYEEEYKVGDWVIGWHAKQEVRSTTAWQIEEIRDGYTYTNGELKYSTGIGDILRKATPEEIEKAQRIEIGGYEVQILNHTNIAIINNHAYNIDDLTKLWAILSAHSSQIKSLNCGCSGNIVVTLEDINKILKKFV